MAKVLTENQRLLTRYLAAVGCPKSDIIHISLTLWEEDEVLEMLEFCASNPDARPAQLLRACSEISSKGLKSPEE